MPTAPPTRCHCGHPATRRGRCDQHQPKPWERPSIRNQKLNRWQWQKTAEDFLRHHPRCAWCGAEATQVDHIIPVADGGALYDHANLQALCALDHDKKTKAEAATRRQRRKK